MFFEDRTDAGKKLAEVFTKAGDDWTGWQVIGLARGGVITAGPVAQALNLSLSALCIDDFQTPKGLYVITGVEGRGLFYNNPKQLGPVYWSLAPNIEELKKLAGFEQFYAKLLAKQEKFDCGQELVIGEKIIVVDDGLASGKSAFTAITALKEMGAKKIVLAVPVVLPWIVQKNHGFSVVTWRVSKLNNAATGMFYYNFQDTPDEDVIEAILGCRQLASA